MSAWDYSTRIVFDVSTATTAYQVGGTFDKVIRAVKIYNGSNRFIDISLNGVTDQDFAPPGSTFILDLQANHDTSGNTGAGECKGRLSQSVHVKAADGAGTGNIYFAGIA